MSIKNRQQKILDISDPKWAHPEDADLWHFGETDLKEDPILTLTDPNIPRDEKLKTIESMGVDSWSIPLDESLADVKTYMAPGCPEEPDAPEIKVWVYTPKGVEITDKMPTMFYLFAGGMTLCMPRVVPIEQLAARYKCMIVAPEYRNSVEAPYPASVNDCHAGYQWMIENAEMLHVDPDNVVLHGESTGGHLATCLPFRLRRYGYSPRGVVAAVAITDDREYLPSSDFRGVDWTGESLRKSYYQWMGPENYASDSVGPEAFANHATVEDCIGYPPLFLHSCEFDPSSDYDREFAGKVKAAHSFVSYHCWGGMTHNINNLDGYQRAYNNRVQATIDADIMDCFTYDLRRPWVEEE
jgi:acetyl esterase/lipase